MSKRWFRLSMFIVLLAGGRLASAAVVETPDPIDVGPIVVNSSGTGDGTLTDTATEAVTLALGTAGDCSQFQIMSPTSLTISPTASTVTVKLSPTSTGVKNCTITVNKGATALTMFGVKGTGTGIAQLTVTPPSPLAFGAVEVGHPATRTVTATNSGTAPLNITSATINTGATNYTLGTAQGNQPIQPGGTLRWDIACAPPAQGPANGNFQIVSDAPTNGTVDVALTCSGDEAVLATNVAGVDFGAVLLTLSRTRPVKLSNNGNVDIAILGATFDKAGYSIDPSTPLPPTLGHGVTLDLTVKFAPVLAGDGGNAKLTFSGAWGAGAANTTTAVVNLTGQTIDVGVAPTALSFNDFLFDSGPRLVFQIVNGGGTTIAIQSVVFVPDAGTTDAEVVIESIKSGTSVVPLPTLLSAGALLDVTVKATPINRMGTVSGHFVVHSTTPGILDQNVTISGNATAATIATTDVDFGPTDIDEPAGRTMTAVISNSGTGPLNVTSVSPLGVTGPFTVTGAPGQVAPNSTMAITLTYKPVAARAAGDPDKLALVVSFGGVINAPPTSTIMVQGRGIDRVFVLGDAPVFPPTFRNPGSKAPLVPVTVRNDGEAVLKITGLTIAGDPVWSLVDNAPVEIAGKSSHDFMVRFAPTTVETVPSGTLTITSDDNAKAMVVVPLTGTAVARKVSFAKMTFEVGYVGVGVPTTFDGIEIDNQDASTTFTIHAIEVGDGYRVADAADAELSPSATRRFTLTFAPQVVGSFETTATLFLDEDPVAQQQVTIKGEAVFVDAHGGGGCDAGGTRGTGGLVIGLAALLLSRRRRHAAIAALAVLAMFAVLAASPAARADGVDLAVFAPTPATNVTGFQLQSPEVGAPGSFAISSILSFASNPLVLEGFDGTGKMISHDALVERSSQLQLGAAFAFLGRFEAGARLPIFTQSGQTDDKLAGLAPAHGTAIGNLVLHGKVRLATALGRPGAFVLGAAASVVIPTATDGQFTGADKPAVRLLALASFTPSALASRLAISINGGGVLRGTTEYANIAQKSAIAWGVGASVRIADPLWATAEVFGEATPSGKRSQVMSSTGFAAETLSPIEWLAGLRVQAGRQLAIGLAGGRGLNGALGTPEVRGVLSLSLVPRAPQLAPIHAIEVPGPDGDADGDGIPDSLDKCPNEPEDKDMFEDNDGCPDLDNDHDGIPDAVDKCPLDPEDKDGFQDEDGCPDKDNDGDGIPDDKDKCPNEPEDKDGFQDLDGCPDPDNDHDGIPDDKDKCPNEAETINGYQDEDGCPDKGDSMILLSPDRIEVLDPVQFAGTKLTRASIGLLGQVGATLRAHTEIVRVRITVHVQPSKDSDADQARSEKRAQVVREWLVQWGIAPIRLEARGFGGAKPLVPPDRRGAAKVNDRIELIILERK